MSDLKILTHDIETSPNVADVWGLFDQNIGLNQVRERQRVICFAMKWYGKPRVEFYAEWLPHGDGRSARASSGGGGSSRKSKNVSGAVGTGRVLREPRSGWLENVPHYDRSKVDMDPSTGVGHEAMIRASWAAMDEADAVISYNGISYDTKHLNREFARYGLGRPSPVQHIDLLQVVKTSFKMTSNKLDDVSRYFLGDVKAHTGGHDLWVRTLAGDPKALRTMARYNKQDVRLTERLYDFFRGQGWIVRHPNLAVGAPAGTCPACGAADSLRPNGTRATVQGGVYQRLRCNRCGASARPTGRAILDRAPTARSEQ